LVSRVLAKDEGTPSMKQIAHAIQEGALAYLRRQYKTIGIIVVPVAVLVFATATKVVNTTVTPNHVVLGFWPSGAFRTLAFVVGALFSGLAGFIGMSMAVRGNVRLIGVVLGAGSNFERDQHMMALLDQGFAMLGVPGSGLVIARNERSVIPAAHAATLGLGPRPTHPAPSIPETPSAQAATSIPSAPEVPSIPEVPPVPEVPSMPEVPSIPPVPEVPSMPEVPWAQVATSRRATMASATGTSRAATSRRRTPFPEGSTTSRGWERSTPPSEASACVPVGGAQRANLE
jgi:hypothetical protein